MNCDWSLNSSTVVKVSTAQSISTCLTLSKWLNWMKHFKNKRNFMNIFAFIQIFSKHKLDWKLRLFSKIIWSYPLKTFTKWSENHKRDNISDGIILLWNVCKCTMIRGLFPTKQHKFPLYVENHESKMTNKCIYTLLYGISCRWHWTLNKHHDNANESLLNFDSDHWYISSDCNDTDLANG